MSQIFFPQLSGKYRKFYRKWKQPIHGKKNKGSLGCWKNFGTWFTRKQVPESPDVQTVVVAGRCLLRRVTGHQNCQRKCQRNHLTRNPPNEHKHTPPLAKAGVLAGEAFFLPPDRPHGVPPRPPAQNRTHSRRWSRFNQSLKMESSLNKKLAYEFNRIGWHAIKHRDGWWLGTEKGVHCFQKYVDAQIVLTAIWQAEGGRELKYRIMPFTGANVIAGEHTFKKNLVEALREYENKK